MHSKVPSFTRNTRISIFLRKIRLLRDKRIMCAFHNHGTAILNNRPFAHSSQSHARKHESEARVDNNQTWRRTVRVARQVVVVNNAACLTAKAPFMTTKGIELAFHFFLSLWKPNLKIVGFWL